MFMIFLLFITALSLSACAALYGVLGLIAIFPTSPLQIGVMGGLLEVAKLVVASWLYRNWKQVPWLLKSYFTIAIIVLMGLTSLGIYGGLSKAHLDQAVPTGDIAAQLELLEDKINTEKGNINAARQSLAQLDQQVNETLNRTKDADNNAAVNRSVTIRRQQSRERAALAKTIETSQAAIAKLNEEKAPISKEYRKVEAEVGPIKYIAALIYGDEVTKDSTFLEKAVRAVTILIVSVFDPLAVLLLIAANWSLVHYKRKTDPKPVVESAPEVKVDEPILDPTPTQREADHTIATHPYLTQHSSHHKNLAPIVAPSPTPTVPESKDSTEHPVFVPGSSYWSKDSTHTVNRPVAKPVDKK